MVIAVVFGTSAGGGIGDVGKYAIAHALNDASFTVRPIAMTTRATAEPNFDIEVDVRPKKLQEELKDRLRGTEFTHIVIEDEDAQAHLEAQFTGVKAVIACVGNRQPGYQQPELRSRWCAAGAELVTAAMKTQNVQRLVILSSFAVAEDLNPKDHAKALFGLILRMAGRELLKNPGGFLQGVWKGMVASREEEIKKDVQAMEKVVQDSSVDYVLVRVSGLIPEEPPAGKWKVLESIHGAKLTTNFFSVAKSDVAMYMLQEAVAGSYHRCHVFLGGAG